MAAAYIDKDVSDAGELLGGSAMFAAMVILLAFIVCIKERGGTGWYVPGL